MNDQEEGSFKAPPPLMIKLKANSKPPVTEKKPDEKVDELEKIAEMAPQPNLLQNLPPPIDYVPPHWASEPAPGICEAYKLEILKNGMVVNIQDFEKRNHNPTFVVIGRLPNCDVVMEHPSVSRYHCILQYGDDKMDKKGKGWFIYDMGSTHGTKMNKNRIPPKQFIRLQVGFVLQFGNSTRICSLLGPVEDADPEWEISPTEMREKAKKKAFDMKLAAAAKKEFDEEKEREKNDEGINWGMDYGEEDDGGTFDLDGEADGEAYYNADPKKALTKFFERVGFEMNFTYSESGAGHNHKWICSIELPVEIDGIDRACTASATVSTSKKDATVQCALEACRILDRHGALRGGSSRLRIKKKNLEENDYYDEDDDLFFDRTGQLEAQRDKRRLWTLKAMGQATEERDTYETLTMKLNATRGQMAEIQTELDVLGSNKQAGQAADVDDYVNQLSKGKITVKDDIQTKIHKSTLRQKLVQLTHEAQTLEKLCKITKPVQLPDLKAGGASAESANKQAFLRKMMKFGNVNKELADVEAKAVAEQSKIADKTPKDTPIEGKIRAPEPKPVHEAHPSICPNSIVLKEFPVIPAVAAPEHERPSTSSEKTFPKIDEKDENLQSEVSQERKRPREEEEEEEGTAKDHKRKRPRIRKEKWDEYGAGCDTKDEQYATWMPPDNQSGDGTTALNAKFAGRY